MSERGVCPECGAPWERVVERGNSEHHHRAGCGHIDIGAEDFYDGGAYGGFASTAVATNAWRPTCGHPSKPVGATILDPFAGSGTVGLVANRLSRRAVLIDLNPAYLEQQMQRNAQVPVGL